MYFLAQQRWNINWALLPISIPTASSQCLWFQQGSFIFVKNMSDAGILDSLLIYYWPLIQEINLWRPLKICILLIHKWKLLLGRICSSLSGYIVCSVTKPSQKLACSQFCCMQTHNLSVICYCSTLPCTESLKAAANQTPANKYILTNITEVELFNLFQHQLLSHYVTHKPCR